MRPTNSKSVIASPETPIPWNQHFLVKVLAVIIFMISGLIPTSFVSADENRAIFYGQPGSYILNDAEEAYDDSDGMYEVEPISNGIIISFSGEGPSNWWNLRLGARVGKTLQPGLYLDATRFPSAIHPMLSLGYRGRGCNAVLGWFEILELERDPDSGDITNIAVRFEHHCEGRYPAVMGQVRFQSNLPFTDPFFPVRLSLATQDATLPGGRDQIDYSSPLTGLTVIDLTGFEIAFISETADGEKWYFGFDSGTPAPLEVGEYGGAVVPDGLGSDKPRLIAKRSEQACESGDGWFEILEYRTDGIGSGIHFAATFELYCDERPNPLYGQIRFDSEEPNTPRRVPALIYAGGDWIAGYEEHTFTDYDSFVSVSSEYDNGITVRAQKEKGSIEYIDALFGGPDDTVLQPGYYPDAQRYTFASPGHPRMEISMNHGGCNTLTGEFTVHELSGGADGYPSYFAIDFVQYCEGTPPPLVGQIRYRSNLPAASIFRGDFEHGHDRRWTCCVGGD